MASFIPTTSIEYIPEWNIERETFIDICHFLPNIRNQQSYICACRHIDDKFNNKTNYDAHIKLKSHKLFIASYGKRATEENKSLKEDNDKKDKEIKILNGRFEKETRRLDRCILERDKLNEKCDELKQERDELKQKYEKTKKERNKYKKERDELLEQEEEPLECD
jgi:hypothetical protein